MTVASLICPWCGAPLPAAAANQPFATCAYCGATASLTGTRATKAEPAKAATAPPVPAANAELRLRVIETFKAAREKGASPSDALVAAARERLGPLGQTDAFARVCLALASDFDAENKTKTIDDPMCMGRMIEIYLMAIEEVRQTGSYDVNMPFFTVTPAGPVHFRRTLTADVIAELAARPPGARAPAPAAAPAGAHPAQPTKKKWFWPFG